MTIILKNISYTRSRMQGTSQSMPSRHHRLIEIMQGELTLKLKYQQPHHKGNQSRQKVKRKRRSGIEIEMQKWRHTFEWQRNRQHMLQRQVRWFKYWVSRHLLCFFPFLLAVPIENQRAFPLTFPSRFYLHQIQIYRVCENSEIIHFTPYKRLTISFTFFAINSVRCVLLWIGNWLPL